MHRDKRDTFEGSTPVRPQSRSGLISCPNSPARKRPIRAPGRPSGQSARRRVAHTGRGGQCSRSGHAGREQAGRRSAPAMARAALPLRAEGAPALPCQGCVSAGAPHGLAAARPSPAPGLPFGLGALDSGTRAECLRLAAPRARQPQGEDGGPSSGAHFQPPGGQESGGRLPSRPRAAVWGNDENSADPSHPRKVAAREDRGPAASPGGRRAQQVSRGKLAAGARGRARSGRGRSRLAGSAPGRGRPSAPRRAAPPTCHRSRSRRRAC